MRFAIAPRMRFQLALCVRAVLPLCSCGDDAAGLGDAGVPDGSHQTADAGLIPPTPDASMFVPGDPNPVSHGPLSAIRVRSVGGLDGIKVHDVAVDGGGGVWATTDDFVLYLPLGGTPRRYRATDGLAEGDGKAVFAGVGAGRAGQAFI